MAVEEIKMATIENMFTEEDEKSDEYRWRYGKQNIKFFVFSMKSPYQESPRYFDKWEMEDEEENLTDVDYLHLKKNLISQFPDANATLYRNRTLEQLWSILIEMETDTALARFDCFVFVFLTFYSKEKGQIEFKDGRVNLSDIWDKVGGIPAMRNCPKIFLVQADDLSLLPKPQIVPKGGEPFQVMYKRIPTDADRLTIFGTVPSRNYLDKNQPSFLIQAFVEAIIKNRSCDRASKQDFLSLTVIINEQISNRYKENCQQNDVPKKPCSPSEKCTNCKMNTKLPLPVVTSTLRKHLYL